MKALEKKLEESTAMSEFGKEQTRDRQTLNPQELDSPVHHAILDSVMKLPLKLQEATLLYYFEKLDFQEISEKLDITVRAVEMRLHRARGILRKRIRIYMS